LHPVVASPVLPVEVASAAWGIASHNRATAIIAPDVGARIEQREKRIAYSLTTKVSMTT
jgi:hypothetical protein